ncbi:purine nucleoside phosphorylase-like [Phalacrocorax aristotelis]|uniref:purine nucleoside phosphorylase-like n=1 Tax=Phalacrocorax aristotelis TaxID=126867 RepID=UPI003F4C4CB7
MPRLQPSSTASLRGEDDDLNNLWATASTFIVLFILSLFYSATVTLIKAPPQVVVPVRTLALAGAHTLVLTNAAGSLRPALGPGHLLVIRDHIDLPGLAGRSPLAGPNDDRFGPRFPAMAGAYDAGLRRLALALAPPELHARPGVYCGVGGPSYETGAECRLLRRLGADAVGMSTVAEASAARHCGLRVLGLSLITNAAPGDDEDEDEEGEGQGEGGEGRAPPPGHEEVLAAAQAGARHLRTLLAALAPRLARPSPRTPRARLGHAWATPGARRGGGVWGGASRGRGVSVPPTSPLRPAPVLCRSRVHPVSIPCRSRVDPVSIPCVHPTLVPC